MSTYRPVILRDSPIRLVFWVIIFQVIFNALYLADALISGHVTAFDEGLFLNLITYDLLVFLILTVMQIAITLYLLVQWLRRSYVLDAHEIVVRQGVFVRKMMKIPQNSIKAVDSHQDFWGRLLKYSTIVISVIGKPEAVVMPYMTDPEQVIECLGAKE